MRQILLRNVEFFSEILRQWFSFARGWTTRRLRLLQRELPDAIVQFPPQPHHSIERHLILRQMQIADMQRDLEGYDIEEHR